MKVNKEEVKLLGAIMYISLLIIAVYFFYITLMLVLPIYKEKKMKRSQKLFFIFLIPCLNEERVIERTITNLLKLNYQNMLIIPIDDASDDRTVERIKKNKR